MLSLGHGACSLCSVCSCARSIVYKLASQAHVSSPKQHIPKHDHCPQASPASMSREGLIAFVFGHIVLLVFDFPRISWSATNAKSGTIIVLFFMVLLSIWQISIHAWRKFRRIESEKAERQIGLGQDFTSTLLSPKASDIDPDQECPFCKERFSDPDERPTPLSLSCGHVYCEACIEKHIVNSPQVRRCPLCQVEIQPKSLRLQVASFQMAFADTVWSTAILLDLYTLVWSITAAVMTLLVRSDSIFLLSGKTDMVQANLMPGLWLASCNAGLGLLTWSAHWCTTWVATLWKLERCGIIWTIQRCVQPLFHLALAYLLFRDTVAHTLRTVELRNPLEGHALTVMHEMVSHEMVVSVATAAQRLGCIAIVLSLWNESNFIAAFPMSSQRWVRLAIDILL